MFTAAILFFWEIPKCVQDENNKISFDSVAHLDWHFMEVG